MEKPKRRFGERAVWVTVTGFLLAVLVLLAFSPRVLAGNREADNQRLLSTFTDVFEDVQKNYVDEVDPQKLIDGALKGMFDSLKDPYSLYLNAEEMRDMGDTTTGKFGGVGLIISKVEGGVEVVSPIEGTPAFRAGVNAGDLIEAVDGSSVAELSIEQVLSVLRGAPGTSVTMSILRGKSMHFDVTRDAGSDRGADRQVRHDARRHRLPAPHPVHPPHRRAGRRGPARLRGLQATGRWSSTCAATPGACCSRPWTWATSSSPGARS